MDKLILELKNEIIKVLNLEGVKPEDIADDDMLFGEGLGLDSIDALELIVLLEKNYGIKLKDPSQGKEIFKSIRTMAEFIRENDLTSKGEGEEEERKTGEGENG